MDFGSVNLNFKEAPQIILYRFILDNTDIKISRNNLHVVL